MDEIKVGSLVLVTGHRRADRVEEVIRETKTMWIVSGNQRFRKDTLRVVGMDSYYYTRIKIATDEIIAKVKKKNMRDGMVIACSRADFSKLSDKTLEAIYKKVISAGVA